VDDVQPGKSVGRRGHNGGSHFGVAAGTGGISARVGRSRAIRMSWEATPGGEVTTESECSCRITQECNL
jgi:hypothetical protein